MPIIWHIMKMYSHYGCREFVVIGGYRIEFLRDYFLTFRQRTSDFTIDLGTGHIDYHSAIDENWRVTVIDSGNDTMTGGRIKRARHFLDQSTFFLTYGDGVSDVPMDRLIETHRAGDYWCTLTAVMQPGRFGALHLEPESGRVEGFREKGRTDGGLINGGFFVCEPEIFDVIDGDETVWEEEPMSRLVDRGKLGSYQHEGYWQSMDSLRDKQILEAAWAASPPWKVWA